MHKEFYQSIKQTPRCNKNKQRICKEKRLHFTNNLKNQFLSQYILKVKRIKKYHCSQGCGEQNNFICCGESYSTITVSSLSMLNLSTRHEIDHCNSQTSEVVKFSLSICTTDRHDNSNSDCETA